jgi:hypothetical protein
MRQPVPDVVVFARKHEGKDCDERAEIAGWYSCNHNGFCIGRAAVLKILNDAASKLCSKTVNCPSRCPCSYVPRKALGSYTARPPWRRVISCRGRKNGIAFAYPSDLAGTRSAELKSCPDYAHNNVLQHPATRIVCPPRIDLPAPRRQSDVYYYKLTFLMCWGGLCWHQIQTPT